MELPLPGALVLAHPGHELFVSAWLRRAKPAVCIFTDGSGRQSAPRIKSAREIVSSVGAGIGPVFGDWADLRLYQAIIEGDLDLFGNLSGRIAEWLVEGEFQSVVCDSYERQYLAHDLCRIVVAAAATQAAARTGRRLVQASFPMYGYKGKNFDPFSAPTCTWRLNDEEFAWKLSSAKSIPDPCLQAEIDQLIEAKGEERLRNELIYGVDDLHGIEDSEIDPPEYERHGERLVEQGSYREVVRYQDHVRPLVEELKKAFGDRVAV